MPWQLFPGTGPRNAWTLETLYRPAGSDEEQVIHLDLTLWRGQ